MTKAFNLLDEPWIPVRTHAGDVRDVGLLDALLHAQEYAGLAETSPPNLAALYRLLLAVTHRALTTRHGPWRDADRARWFRDGLPESVLRDYLEHWRERFWLFHPEYPFMQVAALAEAPETKDKFKPWTQLALERTGGDAPLVFDRSLDSQPVAIAWSVALRNLLGYLQFTPGGLVKTFKTADYAGPLASTAAILPIGNALAETLVLLLHPFSRDSSDDLPSWEVPSPVVADIMKSPTLPSGHDDRYTRLTRSVLFKADDSQGRIRWLRFSEGLALEDDTQDPMVCYRLTDKAAIRVSFTEGRNAWRDLTSMIPDTTGKYDVQAASLGWATNLYAALNDESAFVTVIAAGWKNARNKAAKILRWRLEQVTLSYEVLRDPDSAQILRAFMRRAEGAFHGLGDICSELIAATMPDPKDKHTQSRASAIQERGPGPATFFSATERALPRLMQTIAAGDIDAAHHHWSVTLVDAAERTWEATRRSLGQSAAVLRAEARAYPKFRHLLRSLAADTDSTVEEIPS